MEELFLRVALAVVVLQVLIDYVILQKLGLIKRSTKAIYLDHFLCASDSLFEENRSL